MTFTLRSMRCMSLVTLRNRVPSIAGHFPSLLSPCTTRTRKSLVSVPSFAAASSSYSSSSSLSSSSSSSSLFRSLLSVSVHSAPNATSSCRLPTFSSTSSFLSTSVSNKVNLVSKTVTRNFGGHSHGTDASDPYAGSEDWGTHFVPREEIIRRTLFIVNGFDKVDKAKVTLEVSFKEIGLDSLDTVEMVMSIEEEFMVNLDDEIAANCLTIKDVVDLIEKTPFAQPEPHAH